MSIEETLAANTAALIDETSVYAKLAAVATDAARGKAATSAKEKPKKETSDEDEPPKETRTYELPIECDVLCDDYVMEIVIDTLKTARLEHQLMCGCDEDTVYEMAEYEKDKRLEAYESGHFVLSILGFLECSEKNGEPCSELQLKLPKAFS
jgi:hypothetical protein